MYNNVGGKLKKLATVLFVIEACILAIYGVILLSNSEKLGIIILLVGPIIAWISSWVLYAFGELVDATCNNERNTREILVYLKGNSDSVSDDESEGVELIEDEWIDSMAEGNIPHMNKPLGFEFNKRWDKSIKATSDEGLYLKYIDGNFSDDYRYMCYLELEKRKKDKIKAEE